MFRLAMFFMAALVLTACTMPSPKVNLDLFLADTQPSTEFTRCIKTDIEGIGDLWATESPFLTEAQVESVFWTVEGRGRPALAVTFTKDGAAAMRNATSRNVSRFMVVELDDTTVLTPRINGAISRQGLIWVNDDSLALLDEFAVSMGAKPMAQSIPEQILREYEQASQSKRLTP